MKKILVVHQSAELYGSDKMLLLFLANLDKTLFLPVVILPSDGPLKGELEKHNIKVVIAPVLKLYRKMFTVKNLSLFIKEIKSGIAILDELNKEYKFDVVYSNTLAVLLGMMYARKRKIKHIWHVHEIIVHPKIIARIFPVLLNKFANVIVCNSNETKKNLVNRIPALEPRCVVVHNGIDIKAGTSIASKTDFGFNENDIIITLVGRINRLKGHNWLLNTYLKYIKDSNVKLFFVGSPVPGQEYYLTETENIIAQNNIQDKIKIMPFTKNLSAVWGVTDIAVVPSTEAESFGLVAVEAMLEKKPVIGSNHGGLTEIVVNNQTGFLIEPNNEKDFGEALQKLIDSKNLRETFGEAGYKRAVEEFSLKSYVDNLTKILLA
jgi:glycosyltransferase involved in cell wall biosynthesis